jgi:hypothetical protein
VIFYKQFDLSLANLPKGIPFSPAFALNTLTFCNGADRRQRRKQGEAVGAAASRMQAKARQTLGAATRSPYLRRKLPPRLPALLSRHFPRSALYLLYICILPVLCAKNGIFFDFRK